MPSQNPCPVCGSYMKHLYIRTYNKEKKYGWKSYAEVCEQCNPVVFVKDNKIYKVME